MLVLQSNVATKLSYGGKFFILVMSHFFLIPTLKELKNRPTFAKVTVKIKVARFLTHSVFVTAVKCKCILNQGSATDPTHGAYQNMQTLVGRRGDRSPSPLPHH